MCVGYDLEGIEGVEDVLGVLVVAGDGYYYFFVSVELEEDPNL